MYAVKGGKIITALIRGHECISGVYAQYSAGRAKFWEVYDTECMHAVAGNQDQELDRLTPSGLDHLINLVAGIHGAQIEEFYYGASVGELGSIIGRGRELLEDLPPHTGSGLLHLDHGAVAEVALNKEDHLIIPHKGLVAADVVEPALHESLDADLILLRSGTGRCKGGWNGGNEGLGVGGYQVLG